MSDYVALCYVAALENDKIFGNSSYNREKCRSVCVRNGLLVTCSVALNLTFSFLFAQL